MDRFKVGLETPGGRIVAYDEGQMAIDRDYNSRDANAEAARFIEGRRELTALIKTITPEQFEYTIDHPERGILTLMDMANMLLGHDMYHIEHLTQYLSRVPVG